MDANEPGLREFSIDAEDVRRAIQLQREYALKETRRHVVARSCTIHSAVHGFVVAFLLTGYLRVAILLSLVIGVTLAITALVVTPVATPVATPVSTSED
jgi:hypothetical protein